MAIKTDTSQQFYIKIHKHAREKHFPLRVMFELTYRCNFKCRHCYVPLSYREKSKHGELKTNEVFSVLDQLKDIGCFYLGFTGGEPFIRGDMIEILWYAKRKGFELIIYTNGSLIDERMAKELSCLRPNKVDITIPAMSKDAFERISGISDSRDKVFKAINLLYKNGVNLGFKTCVLKENKSEIKDIQDFAHFLGALHRLDTLLSPRFDGSKAPYKYRGELSSFSSLKSEEECNLTKLTNSTNSMNSTNSKNSINSIKLTHELFRCGVGRTQAAITPLGELKMCLMIDYPKYKILKGSLKDAWEKLKEVVKSIKPDENYQCNKCELEPYCKWCPARGWLQNRNFTACDPENRRWAELRKNSYEDNGKRYLRNRLKGGLTG